jgi:hypothetical protein
MRVISNNFSSTKLQQVQFLNLISVIDALILLKNHQSHEMELLEIVLAFKFSTLVLQVQILVSIMAKIIVKLNLS